MIDRHFAIVRFALALHLSIDPPEIEMGDRCHDRRGRAHHPHRPWFPPLVMSVELSGHPPAKPPTPFVQAQLPAGIGMTSISVSHGRPACFSGSHWASSSPVWLRSSGEGPI